MVYQIYNHVGIIKAFQKLGAKVTPLVYRDYTDRSKFGLLKKKLLSKKFNLIEDKFLECF